MNRSGDIERLWLFSLNAWRQTLERGYYRVVWYSGILTSLGWDLLVTRLVTIQQLHIQIMIIDMGVLHESLWLFSRFCWITGYGARNGGEPRIWKFRISGTINYNACADHHAHSDYAWVMQYTVGKCVYTTPITLMVLYADVILDSEMKLEDRILRKLAKIRHFWGFLGLFLEASIQ